MRALRLRVRTLMAAVGLVAVLVWAAMMGFRSSSITRSPADTASKSADGERKPPRVASGEKTVWSAPTSAPRWPGSTAGPFGVPGCPSPPILPYMWFEIGTDAALTWAEYFGDQEYAYAAILLRIH